MSLTAWDETRVCGVHASVGRPPRCSMPLRSANGRSGHSDSCSDLAEPGNWPAAAKAVADWFPARQRALGIGIFNAGSSIGSAIAPFDGRADHVSVRLANGLCRSPARLESSGWYLVGPLRSAAAEPVARPEEMPDMAEARPCHRRAPDRTGSASSRCASVTH